MIFPSCKDKYNPQIIYLSHNNAYFEISNILENFGFFRAQGSVYLTENNDLVNVTRAMIALKNIDWFRKSVRDIRAFKVEDWSNFTDFMKEIVLL